MTPARPPILSVGVKTATALYTYVPADAVDIILDTGLHSSKSLLDKPELLEQAAKGRNKSPEEFRKKVEEGLRTWKAYALKGPNAVFHPIPDSQELEPNHPTKERKLVPLKIDLDRLMRDHPKTKLYGMELVPYASSRSPGSRHHYIGEAKIKSLASRTPKKYWSSYNDEEHQGLYAPDVPHVAIHTPEGFVSGKYLSKLAQVDHRTSPMISSATFRSAYDEGVKLAFQKLAVAVQLRPVAPITPGVSPVASQHFAQNYGKAQAPSKPQGTAAPTPQGQQGQQAQQGPTTARERRTAAPPQQGSGAPQAPAQQHPTEPAKKNEQAKPTQAHATPNEATQAKPMGQQPPTQPMPIQLNQPAAASPAPAAPATPPPQAAPQAATPAAPQTPPQPAVAAPPAGTPPTPQQPLHNYGLMPMLGAGALGFGMGRMTQQPSPYPDLNSDPNQLEGARYAMELLGIHR